MTARSYHLSPGLIRVGCGVSKELAGIVSKLGRSCLIVADRGGRTAAEATLGSLEQALPDARVWAFEGECTQGAIDRIARHVGDHDLFVSVGGGKALDAAKAAAATVGSPCVTVPTSAATCAAYTPLSIVHEANGAYVESRRLPQSVRAMIVDPDLIVTAPRRLLAAGIVDALARAFDTILAAQVGVPTATASMSLAICESHLDECLLPLGAQALADNARGEATDAFVRVVEACIVGAGLAGETGARFFGRSFSHAVAYALSRVVDPDRVLHGEAAGLGVLVHCALDQDPPVALDAMLGYFEKWEVPTSFAEVGVLDVAGETGAHLAAQTLDYLDLERAVPFPVEASDIHRAIREIESRSDTNRA